MKTTSEVLKDGIDLQKLLDNLDFTEEEVISAAQAQAKLYVEAVRYRVQKMRKRNAAETALDVMKSELSMRIRKNSDEKKTEGHIKDMVNGNKTYQEAINSYNRSMEEEEFAKRLLDAYEQRMQALRIVSSVMGFEVGIEKRMSERAAELSKTKQALKEKYRGE